MSKYNRTIPTKGPAGNIYAMLANAVCWMRQEGEDTPAVKALQEKVSGSKNYTEACSHIQEYFHIEGKDDKS